MTENNSLDWIPFYEDLANKLLPYRTRQKELIDFLEQLRSQGLTITPMEDMDESGRRFRLTEIDPFTFYGSFNRMPGQRARRVGRPRVIVDARGIATLRKAGASWATICQETGPSKGTA